MKIKKLSKNPNESEMEEFITGRGKSPQEIETQIGRLAEKFQELEQVQGTVSEGKEFQEFGDLGNQPLESDDSLEVEVTPIINYHQEERRKKAGPLEVEIYLSGKYSFANMIRSNLEESNEANAVLRSEFPQQEDVNCIVNYQIPMIFGGYNLGIDEQVEQAATLIFANFHKPSWRTLKHHLSQQRCHRNYFGELRFCLEMIRRASLNKNGCLEG